MDTIEALEEAFTQIRTLGEAAVEGADVDVLTWRPDPGANPIGWLVWHLTRVQDDHVADLAERDQVWTQDDWPSRFGLASDDDSIGYGHTREQVAAVRPETAAVLVAYLHAVTEQTIAHLHEVDPEELDRVIDRSWDPPVTAGVRLLSVVGDCLQHVGQAAYVRGLHERC
jgi:hypothetical protein